MITIDDINFYVAHYRPLCDRKTYIDNIFQYYGIPITYITEYDKEEINQNVMRAYYNPSAWKSHLQESNYYDANIPFRSLRPAEISLCIKFSKFLDLIQSQSKYSMWLEDDVILCEDWKNTFSRYLEKLDNNWDMIFWGDSYNLKDGLSPDMYFYTMIPPRSKCSESILINPRSYLKIKECITPFSLPLDFSLTRVCGKLGLRVYWAEPPIFLQGSSFKYKSSIA